MARHRDIKSETVGELRSVRRSLVGLLIAAVVMPWSVGRAAAQGSMPRTPAQTEGPFYPLDWSGDIDNDLVVVAGRPGPAKGDVLHVRGLVTNSAGEPVAGATVEIWQTDANGIYLHPEDERPGRRRDVNFQGRGRTQTDASGAYAFRTIKPVPYDGRTPHIHFKISHPRYRALTTQMYQAGDPLNARDGIVRRLAEAQRRLLMVAYEPADGIERGARLATFNICLG
jgi:protocatechuate 3,4-dioxygenase beta subunit